MSTWWSGLGAGEHVFCVIALASSAALVIQLLLNLIGLAGHDVDADAAGADADVDVDGDFDADHPDALAHSSGLGLISLRSVVAFFVGFGWGGLALRQYRVAWPLAVLLAVCIGFCFLLTVFWLMKWIFKLSESGNVDYANAAGQTGTVYLTVPARGGGSGQVQLVVQGRMREMPAVTEDSEALAPGTQVQVTKVVGGSTAVVRKQEVK